MGLILNNQTNQWEEGKKGEGIYLDGYLREKLDHVKEMKKNGWDIMFIITGREGSGKSTLSFVCAQYLTDMKLTMDNIAAGTDDAFAKLKSLPDESLLIIDEAELMFSSRDTMNREQRQLTTILQIIRQKRMTLILVSPVFFDLSKYIAVDRSRFVIKTYTEGENKRGYFVYWGEERKILLYHLGKKHFGSYAHPDADFYGRFTDYKLPFDDLYQQTKKKSLFEAFEKPQKPQILPKKQVECKKCGHIWLPKIDNPIRCQNCKALLLKQIDYDNNPNKKEQIPLEN